MIHEVEKYLFVGVQGEVDRFFERAQKEGIIQFIHPSGKKMVETPESLKDVSEAITILRKQPVPESWYKGSEKDSKRIAHEIVEINNRLENLYEERRILQSEAARISPFGDFSLEEIREIEQETGKHIQFFAMKEAVSHKVEIPEHLIYLATEYDMDYFLSISEKYVSIPNMIEMHFDRSLSQLKERLNQVFVEIQKNEGELKHAAKYLPLLREHFIDEINRYTLAFAKNETTKHLEDAIFTVQGWIPSNLSHKLDVLLQDLAVHSERIEEEPEDVVPTYMENTGPNRLGEDLVHIYDVPATKDKDPSGWVFWAFVVFFSMIVADAGYGLLFLGLSYFFLWKFKKVKGAAKRAMKLFNALSWGCCIWGILIGSYFGLDISPENPLKKYTLIQYLTLEKAKYHIEMKDDVYQRWIDAYPDLKEAKTPSEFLLGARETKEGSVTYQIIEEFSDNILLEISLMIGVIHICLSLLRYIWRSWSNIGWCAFIIGGYLYFPSMLDATSMLNFLGIVTKIASAKIGLQLLVGGVSLAFILAVIQKRMKGLAEVAHLIQIFADVLSYLRIYALGLAAMIMAATFNKLGKEVGLVGGLVIILAGHIVNITLAVMGGVIHGLRLNFIEWYHYSFEGDGKIFSPLKLREK
ncbi:MAG: V-type ATP synthase subunit I [Simkaniaceae bacterium]